MMNSWDILYYGVGIYLCIGLLISIITLNSMLKLVDNASDDDDEDTKEIVDEVTKGIEAIGEKLFILSYIFLTTLTWLNVLIDAFTED